MVMRNQTSEQQNVRKHRAAKPRRSEVERFIITEKPREDCRSSEHQTAEKPGTSERQNNRGSEQQKSE
jgi:hypothetical protein